MTFLRSISYSSLARHKVIVSHSRDIFVNLAFEKLLHLNLPKDNSCLLLYRNKPCIVIGKFQNPWIEMNADLIKQRGIKFARRCSGGGTVYHDLGNLNLSFLAARNQFKKKDNLSFLAEFLRSCHSKKVVINDRSDLVFEGGKVSGSASRVEKERSIHHLTLLLHSDLHQLRDVLGSNLDIETRATRSVPALVNNIFTEDSSFDFDEFAFRLGQFYCSRLNFEENIGTFDPSEFEEVEKEVQILLSWDWQYALTPKFVFKLQLHKFRNVMIKFNVHRAIVKEVSFEGDLDLDLRELIIGCTLDSKFLKSEILTRIDQNISSDSDSILKTLQETLSRLPLF